MLIFDKSSHIKIFIVRKIISKACRSTFISEKKEIIKSNNRFEFFIKKLKLI